MAKKPFQDLLKEGRLILADGAMGTSLYSRGIWIDTCYDSLNLSNPQLIEAIHLEYISAGAEIIETNTFGANQVALSRQGLGKQTLDMNKKGVEIAKKAVSVSGKDIYVAGSVGPVVVVSDSLKDIKTEISHAELEYVFTEQVNAIVGAGADLIIFETFGDLDELLIAVKAARREHKDIPIIAQLTPRAFGKEGSTPREAARKLQRSGVTVIGVNCGSPEEILQLTKQLKETSELPLSAMPNATGSRLIAGRTMNLASPEYLADFARYLSQAGASVIGGCCGTTSDMILWMSNYLRSVGAQVTVSNETLKSKREEACEAIPIDKRSTFGAALSKKFPISAEIHPPQGIDVSEAVKGAKILKGAGADIINIPDGPRGTPRLNPAALANIIHKEVGIETLVHVTTRDQSINGLQGYLKGLHLAGIRNLLLVTGDPPKMSAGYPISTGVFDIDSIGLIRMVDSFNHGVDPGGKKLHGGPTSFVIGAGCDPGSPNIETEIARYQMKIEAGAEFFFSQPVYDIELLKRFFELTKDCKEVSFFIGILPLPSLKRAQYFNDNVPGLQIPPPIIDRMGKEKTLEEQKKVGIEIARETLVEAKNLDRVTGAYIFPAGNYESVKEVI